MLTDHERRQWDALEAQLTGGSYGPQRAAVRARPARRQSAHRRRALLLAVAATVFMAVAHLPAFVPLVVLSALAWYLVAPGSRHSDPRRNRGRGRKRASGQD